MLHLLTAAVLSAGAKPRRKAPALKPASKVINIVPSSKGFEDSKRRRKVTKRWGPQTSMTDCLPAAAAWPWVPAKPAAAQPCFVVLLLGLGLLQSGIHACSVTVGHSLPEWHDLRCRFADLVMLARTCASADQQQLTKSNAPILQPDLSADLLMTMPTCGMWAMSPAIASR